MYINTCAQIRNSGILENVGMHICRVTSLVDGRGGGKSPHPPGVPVLVTHLLLHLGVREGLQERAPNTRLTLVPETDGDI